MTAQRGSDPRKFTLVTQVNCDRWHVMSRRRFDEMNCGIAQALEAFGDWWSLLIIREAFFGTRRFALPEDSRDLRQHPDQPARSPGRARDSRTGRRRHPRRTLRVRSDRKGPRPSTGPDGPPRVVGPLGLRARQRTGDRVRPAHGETLAPHGSSRHRRTGAGIRGGPGGTGPRCQRGNTKPLRSPPQAKAKRTDRSSADSGRDR